MPRPPGTDLNLVLAAIARRDDCQVLPPAGQARVPDGLALPADVLRFHDHCGGVVLFTGAEFPWHVAIPNRVVPASPRLLTPEVASRVAVENPEDLTNGCFVIADGGRESSTDPHIVIDLHPDRLGRCYVASWDTYGVVGEMPIVALTMAELLRSLLEHDGRATALPDFYGDAYEPRLPWQPGRLVELDEAWLSQWRDVECRGVCAAFARLPGWPARRGEVVRPQ